MFHWPWSKKADHVSVAEIDAIVDGLKAMAANSNPENWGHIAEQHPVMLTQHTFDYLQMIIDDQRKNGVQIVAISEVMLTFLRQAHTQGIPTAVATEKRRREEVNDAVARFLSVAPRQIGQTLRERQSTLLTADAIRMAKKLVRLVAQADDPDDSMLGFKRRDREARVRFLEDALAHDIAAAENHYAETFVDNLAQSTEEYLDATDPDRE